MPFDAAKLGQPKYLIVGAVALAGGLYFAYRMRQPSAEPILSSSVAQPVSDSASLQRADDLTRQLSELEQKRKEQQQAAEDRIANLSATSTSERAQLEARLMLQNQQLSSQYDAQISQLKAEIERLKIPSIGINPPTRNEPRVGPSIPLQPPGGVRHEIGTPLPPPVYQSREDIPGGYPASCDGVIPYHSRPDRPFSHDTNGITDFVARIKREGNHASQHIPMREAFMFSFLGVKNQSNVVAARDVYTTGIWAAGSINKVRRENGLRALPQAAIAQLHNDFVNYTSSGAVEPTIALIHQTFNGYYWPYQC